MNKQGAGKQGSNWIWMAATGILLIAGVVYVSLFPPVQKAGESVATVNGVSITKDQLYESLLEAGGAQTLQGLIDKELVRQEADKAGIKVTDADKEKELDNIKKSFPSEEEFQMALASYGMTMEDLTKDMDVQIQLRKLIEPQVSVTDEQIKTYYDENLESLKEPEQVRASHILVATEDEAKSILAELKNGADFAKLAQEKSTDPGSKDAGGDLDYFGKGMMHEPFETAAFALKVGELSDVVKSESGYHIIKVADHKEARTPTLDEKKEEIRDMLFNQQISTLSGTWMEEKRSGATIDNTLEEA